MIAPGTVGAWHAAQFGSWRQGAMARRVSSGCQGAVKRQGSCGSLWAVTTRRPGIGLLLFLLRRADAERGEAGRSKEERRCPAAINRGQNALGTGADQLHEHHPLPNRCTATCPSRPRALPALQFLSTPSRSCPAAQRQRRSPHQAPPTSMEGQMEGEGKAKIVFGLALEKPAQQSVLDEERDKHKKRCGRGGSSPPSASASPQRTAVRPESGRLVFDCLL